MAWGIEVLLIERAIDRVPLVLSNGAVGVEKRTPDMDVPKGWLSVTGVRLFTFLVR